MKEMRTIFAWAGFLVYICQARNKKGSSQLYVNDHRP